MAGAAFKDKDVVKALANFTPILVDGDVEKSVVSKFGVSGYPNVVFANAKGKKVKSVVGAVPTREFLAAVEAAAKKAGKPRPSKDYKTLTKAETELSKALAKKQWSKAIVQIAKIEKVGRPGRILDHATTGRAAIEKLATEQIDLATQHLEAQRYDEAQKVARVVLREFRGLTTTEKAAKDILAKAKAATEGD